MPSLDRKRTENDLAHPRQYLMELVDERTSELRAEIRERRRAEEALQASEKKYRSLFETANDAVFLADAETGLILEANPRAAELLGMPLDSVVGMHQSQVHPPGDAERYEEIFQNHVSQGKGNIRDVWVRRRDGTLVPVEINASVTEINGKRVIHGIFRDVTEGKRAEDLIRGQRDLGVTLSGTQSLQEGLKLCLDAALEAAGFTMGGVYLVDEETGALDLAFHKGLSEDFVNAVLHYGPGSDVARFVKVGQPFYGNHSVLDFPRFAVEENAGLRALAVLPVCNGDRVVASVNIASMEADSVPLAVQPALEGIAAQIGGAIARLRIENALWESRERLHSLAARLTSVREEERAAVARDIHDGLGHELTALKLDLALLAKAIRKAGIEEGVLEGIGQRIRQLSEHVDRTVKSVRAMATQLRPPVLDEGLQAAIEWQAQEFESRTGICCVVDLDMGEMELPDATSTALFRIVQEVLTNVARHADALSVEIRSETRPDYLTVTVTDDGCGLDAEQASRQHSLGLLGMQERARALGGDVTLKGVADEGTTVTIRIPREGRRPRR